MRTFGLICLVGCLGFLIGRADLGQVPSQTSRGGIDRSSPPRPIEVECANGICDSETSTDNDSDGTIKLASDEEIETATASDSSTSVEIKYVYGHGLVVGLNGTGGQSLSTDHMALEYATRLNVATKRDQLSDEDSRLFSNNFCQVIVTIKLLKSAKKDSRIEATVSVLDDAMSLQNGTLLPTELKGTDGNVYAIAEGPVSPYTSNGTWQSHPTVARLKYGAELTRDFVVDELLEATDSN